MEFHEGTIIGDQEPSPDHGIFRAKQFRSNSLTIFSPQRCGLFVFSLIFNDTEVAFRFDDNITSENRTLVFSARIL